MMNEQEKFKEIYDKYWLEIKRFIFVETGRDAALTDDIFQNTWMNAYNYLSSLKDESAVRAWLYSIAKNETRRYFYKNKTRILSDINTDTDDEFKAIEDEEASEYPDTLANEEVLVKLLAKLNPAEQQLILLHYYYDLPIIEIAEINGVNYNSLKSSVRRALMKLRRLGEESKEACYE